MKASDLGFRLALIPTAMALVAVFSVCRVPQPQPRMANFSKEGNRLNNTEA